MDDRNEADPRGALRGWLATQRGLDLSDPEVEAAAARLRAERDAALPLLLEQFVDPDEDAALLAIATVALKGWAEPYPVEALMALLQSPTVGALPKALIMTVLERYGIDPAGSGVSGVGINLEDYEIAADDPTRGVSKN